MDPCHNYISRVKYRNIVWVASVPNQVCHLCIPRIETACEWHTIHLLIAYVALNKRTTFVTCPKIVKQKLLSLSESLARHLSIQSATHYTDWATAPFDSLCCFLLCQNSVEENLCAAFVCQATTAGRGNTLVTCTMSGWFNFFKYLCQRFVNCFTAAFLFRK